MNRRQFLTQSAGALASVTVLRSRGASATKSGRPPRVLLRNLWQTVNIGDIGHTPGALSLLEKYFPEAEITLWPRSTFGHGTRELLTEAYPRLKIVEGPLDAQGKPGTPALAKAWAETDFYLSGSGSGFPSRDDAIAFHRATGKPVGVFGVSTDPMYGFGPGQEPEGGTLRELRRKALALPPTHLPENLRYIIDRASFFFCRDTISRDYLKNQGVKTPILEFGPDAQLGMHLRDDAKGFGYLKAKGLEDGKFICVIPRLRYTPYHKFQKRSPAASDAVKDAINARTAVKDHEPLRGLIVAYVRNTGNKALVCPEMTYEIELSKEQLVDPLPADVKKNVVWRDTYWLPDEAASVYSKALALVSIECHSPLIALHNGTPTFHIRNPTDTCKGQMYRDLGMDDWFFEIEETSGAELWSRLEPIHRDPARARAKVKEIYAGAARLQKRMVDAVRAAAVPRS
jgi:hypothetical protein